MIHPRYTKWIFSFHHYNNNIIIIKVTSHSLTFTALQKRKLMLQKNFFSTELKNNASKSYTEQSISAELLIDCKKGTESFLLARSL